RNGVENQGDLLIIDPDPPFVYLANALAQRLRRFSTIKNSASSCLKRFNHGFGPRRLQQYDNPARLRGASKFPEYPEPALCIFVREYAQDNDVNVFGNRSRRQAFDVQIRTEHIQIGLFTQ